MNQEISVTKEDIIAAYKIFLNRLPESSEVMQAKVGKGSDTVLIGFTLADEFLKRPEVAEVILKVAQKVVQEQKMIASNPENQQKH
jgi:hypothetical protein